MAAAKTKDTRSRNFATVVYPDSAPENWLSIASELCVPAFISPLHDKDVNPTGEDKKPHWHVMFMFEGKKSIEQVQELFISFGGVGIEKVNSIRSYARYLCHLDNPDKAQLVRLCGFVWKMKYILSRNFHCIAWFIVKTGSEFSLIKVQSISKSS